MPLASHKGHSDLNKFSAKKEDVKSSSDQDQDTCVHVSVSGDDLTVQSDA